MRVKLEICFKKSTLKKSDYKNIIDKLVVFTPYFMTCNNKTSKWDEEKCLSVLSLGKMKGQVFIVDEAHDNYLSMGNAGSKDSFLSITLCNILSLGIPSDRLIEELISKNGFISAYLLNDDYETVQSETFSNNLKGKDFSKEILDSIKDTPARNEMWGGKEYDVRFNPGRSILIDYTWLMTGWRMWFGEEFFKLVSKNILLSFPFADQVKELSNGIVYVQLYNNIQTPYTTDAVFKQWKWREWLDYDGLESGNVSK